ncbi:histidine kinase N-terminal 7TM domain-containing protein [Methanocella sp. MCL-LM]|uniref:histidine kinase N-terminal 7TM domain-containing protein n=1 Tax=Methanocella sp. MCL-LM TaxID=3412035 RepID=UPI003C78EC12
MIHLSNYALACSIAMVLLGILAWYVWTRRKAPGGLYFSLMLAALSQWALMNVLETLVVDLPAKVLCSKLSYLGILSTAPLWFLFALDYSRRQTWLKSKFLGTIWILPAISLLLVLTNDWHGLIWPGISTIQTPEGLVVIYDHGIGVVINSVYSYTLVIAGSALILWTAIRQKDKNYLQKLVLVLGAIMPLLGSMSYNLGLSPFRYQDITPVIITVSGLIFAWASFSTRMFDLVPAAREVLIGSMADGVVVIDQDGTIADINAAAIRMTDIRKPVIGLSAESVFEAWPELTDLCHGEKDVSSEIRLDSAEGKPSIWVNARASVLYDDKGEYHGHVIALWDITGRKNDEDAIRRTNESLKAEVAERRKAEVRLTASLREKELLLKEIHHRVKNNLQILSSLLSLQGTGSTVEDASNSLKESQNRIKSMALIHEKLYRSADLARIDFKEYVESLIVSLSRSYVLNPKVRILVDMEDVSLDLDTAITCGLIINELITNSLKYAFPGDAAGEIRVSMSREATNYRLTVGDTGIGLPAGMDFRNSPSLGLQLVVTLTEQLTGEIELLEGRGTAYRITFERASAL